MSWAANINVIKTYVFWIVHKPSPGNVGVQTSQLEMLSTYTDMLSWESYDEDISSLDDSLTLTSNGLLEQINVTRDMSDYLWYITR
ncbi:hypothetical protein CFOL_v3_32859 [Cephalotus follicularis]|uniref:Uncharacterized protein n=1 Tax=Cephalotus follicularis TaxID=3775 RepID=A0A1Q3DAI3_CEPFO|nr:hypothetical protein CFOL_v3_32859 [Cephalotus follicularis]